MARIARPVQPALTCSHYPNVHFAQAGWAIGRGQAGKGRGWGAFKEGRRPPPLRGMKLALYPPFDP